MPIYEPGLTELVQRNYQAGRPHFTTDAEAAVAFMVLQFIAVGTPPDEDSSANLQYVLAVGRYLANEKVVVTKSTVPVSTAGRVHEALSQALAQRGANVPFDVCYNPDFLKEGSAIEDFNLAARIVMGTDSERVC